MGRSVSLLFTEVEVYGGVYLCKTIPCYCSQSQETEKSRETQDGASWVCDNQLVTIPVLEFQNSSKFLIMPLFEYQGKITVLFFILVPFSR